MRKVSTAVITSFALLMLLFMVGCGQETATLGDTTRPFVTATTPVAGATGVSLTPPITATFSKPMNTASINTTTFQLAGPGGAAVAGTVSYTTTGSIATFTPAAALTLNTTYVATITTGAQDQAVPANSLPANYVWSFTTLPAGATPTPPEVIATNPVDGATNVPLGQAISATFSETMNPASINATTFTVDGPGGVLTPGKATYSSVGNIATFTPAAALTANTTYVATITTGAQNTSGTGLATNYTWTFTTVPPPPPPVPPVAPTVIATNPASNASNVPVNQIVTATFSTALNPATVSTSTFTISGPGGAAVVGTVTYAGTIATFTPAAALAVNTTYLGTITTGVQDAAGTALANNYTWTFTTVPPPPPPVPPVAPTVIATNPASHASNVPVNQVVSATFSTALNPATVNASTFTISGPGGAAVAGTVTYAGTIATFLPNAALAVNTTYLAAITTGVQDAAGTALASNYTWTFTTVPAPVLPTVLSTTPVNGATGVPVTQPISAVFSKAMNPATLNATTFTVAGPGATNIAGVVTYSAFTDTATFTPAGNLATGATYIATITTGAQDTTGDALAANYVFAFRTVAAPTPPTVIATNPAANATGVPFNQKVAATFSGAMDSTTINATTFLLTAPGGIPVAGTVTYVAAGSIATFSPTAALLPDVTYVATITTGAQDSMGVALASNYVWAFTTGAAPDTTRPTVIATFPINGATAVPFNQAISATFSKAINPNTVTATSFTLTGPGLTQVNGLVSYAAISNTATFTPTANLAASTTFTATITTAVADLAGNTLLTNYVWTFTTGAAPDTTHPTIVSTVPVNAATGVALNQAVSATFSKAMNPLTLTNATFQLTDPTGNAVAATIAYDPVAFIATLQPTLPLIAGTTYTVTVTSGAADVAGNALIAGGTPNPWIFTTGAIVFVPPVNLGTATLFGGFGGAAGMTNQGTSTVINGDIGTTGVSTLITGFHDLTPGCTYTETPLNMGFVNGAIDTAPPPPTVACPNEGTAVTSAIATKASEDASAAYASLVAIPGGLDVSTCPGCGGGSAGELGNRTLVAGTYKSAPGTYGITQGDLTLDAKGNPNAFWVFQAATTLTVGSPTNHRSVLLVNGAQAKNVYWQVGTAATVNGILGGGTMSGTIIAQSGVSVSTAGVAAITTINGRALSLVGPVTVVNTVINVPAP